MGLRGWIKRLERGSAEELISIPQVDGSVKRFSEADLKAAFLNGIDRATAEREEDRPPEHPLLIAAKNSSDPKWRNSFYADFEIVNDAPLADLSEPRD